MARSVRTTGKPRSKGKTMTKKTFASQVDLEEKRISFVQLAKGAYA